MSRSFVSSLLVAALFVASAMYWGGYVAAALPVSMHDNMPFFTMGIYVLALFVSWLYRKPAAFFMLLFFLPVTVVSLFEPAAFASGRTMRDESMQILVVFFLGLNFICFSMIKNRSVINRAAMKWWAWIGLQWALMYALVDSGGVLSAYFYESSLHIGKWVDYQGKQWQLTDVETFMIAAVCLFLFIFLFVKRNALYVSLSLFYFLFVIASIGEGSPFYFELMILIPLFFYLVVMVFESYKLAYYDELTMLPNRRALQETIKSLGSYYVIAMLDIDHFKRLNDRYGHDVGDQVLRFVATIIEQHIRGGRVFRYGGEEFMLIFPTREFEKTRQQLEALREKIAHRSFNLRRKNNRLISGQKKRKKITNKNMMQHIRLTISIGVAMRSESADTPDSVIKRADERVYKAKKCGRNRVVALPS